VSRHSLNLDDALLSYLRSVSLREPEILRRLRAETAEMEDGIMQISPEQGQFMQLLVELIGAQRCLEVGTFTGYSALAVALALGPQGRVVACDLSEAYTAVGRRYWAEAGVADRVDLRIGPAVQTLDSLIEQGESGRFDFAFIDADKPNYERYYEQCLTLLRVGGLLAIDNVLWGGSAANPDDDRPATRAIQALNRQVHADARVSISLVPIGDGLTLCRKRA